MLKTVSVMTSALLAASCGIVGTGDLDVLCERSAGTRDALSDQLLRQDVPDETVVTGARLIAQVDSACGWEASSGTGE